MTQHEMLEYWLMGVMVHARLTLKHDGPHSNIKNKRLATQLWSRLYQHNTGNRLVAGQALTITRY